MYVCMNDCLKPQMCKAEQKAGNTQELVLSAGVVLSNRLCV